MRGCTLSTRAGDESFNLRDLSRQSFSHPFHALGSDQHIVFDAHAYASIFFKRRTQSTLKLVPVLLLPTRGHVVKGIRSNVDPRLVGEYHSGFQPGAVIPNV